MATVLPGGFNLANAATAVATAIAAGVEANVAAAGVAASPGVPGRLERVEVGSGVHAFVDYAHTPDAVEQVIAVFRDSAADTARIVLVLGCGGERDTGKRAAMGAAATTADVAVLTSDNPRSEDPAVILAAVEAGARDALIAHAAHTAHIGPSPDGDPRPSPSAPRRLRDPARLLVEPDRRAAITAALAETRNGDVLLVAGKGHEVQQILADGPIPFDDRQVLREAAAALGRGRR